MEDMVKRVGLAERNKLSSQLAREFPLAWLNGKRNSKFCILQVLSSILIRGAKSLRLKINNNTTSFKKFTK